jgi:hypothetical protein
LVQHTCRVVRWGWGRGVWVWGRRSSAQGEGGRVWGGGSLGLSWWQVQQGRAVGQGSGAKGLPAPPGPRPWAARPSQAAARLPSVSGCCSQRSRGAPAIPGLAKRTMCCVRCVCFACCRDGASTAALKSWPPPPSSPLLPPPPPTTHTSPLLPHSTAMSVAVTISSPPSATACTAVSSSVEGVP